MNKEKFSLKDHLFNKAKVEKLAEEILLVYKKFDKESFVKDILKEFPKLELKQRITCIAENLKKYLPENYREALEIIIKALPKENNPTLTDNDFGYFIYAPYGEFIAKYGCNKKDLTVSLNAIYEITKRFSMEDAIRYFINVFPDETFREILKWSRDKNYHVRRLASEGTRPKLPWSQKINLKTDSTIKILNNLYFDKTRYVTRSVANHINDISKIDSELAIQTLEKWKSENEKSKKQSETEMNFIIKHALRDLIKKGNKKALKMLNLNHDFDIEIKNFNFTKKVKLNNFFEFNFEIYSKKDSDLLIDYILYFQNKNGEMKSKKVFKLKRLNLSKDEKVIIAKKHKFIENMTTRKIYKGWHKLEIQINGIVVADNIFEVI